MGIRKFRNVDEMNQPTWREPGDAELYRTIARVWAFGQRTNRRSFPPGVHRHRSLQELNAQTERWSEADIQRRHRG
jgi:hypothetical protein